MRKILRRGAALRNQNRSLCAVDQKRIHRRQRLGGRSGL